MLCLSVCRISSPTGVPPGSRNVRTVRPRDRNSSASSEICVDLPLPSVPSKVMNRPDDWCFFCMALAALQLRSLGRILDEPAFGFQLFAQGIGSLEIFGLAGSLTRLQQLPGFFRRFDFRC